MPLKQLEVENFKSYRGRQVIGPFSTFSAVIGPNGSGKSNLMDAISFVLGVRSTQLRSSQLRDLVYRGGATDGAESDSASSSSDEEGVSRRASVTAVIEDGKHLEHRFQRTITATGGSEYRYNGRVVSQNVYNTRLEQLNLLVQARNVLVFQGDVEAVAAQSSRDLSRVVDQISGSGDLREEYDAARTEYNGAVERSSALVARRKALYAEVRQYRQQKEASERLDALKAELAARTVRQLVWRLYHIHEVTEIHTDWIEAHAAHGEQLRRRHAEREALVSAARSELGKVQQAVMDKENAHRQLVRAAEATNPARDQVRERIAHSERKQQQAESMRTQTQRDLEKQERELARLAEDVARVERAAAEARGAQEAALASSSLRLSDADQQAYHDLRAQASTHAVQERRELEGARRESKLRADAADAARDALEVLRGRTEHLEHERSALREAHAALEERTARCERELATERGALDRMRVRRDEIAARETQLNEALVACYNKLLQMGQDLRVHEREARLREALRALRNIYPDVHGRLLDLCQPTQRKYELALATVFGRNADAVVVGRESTAVECIEYLRNQRAGQATFIPLDTVQTKPVNDRFRSLAVGARLAVDVVQHTPAVERAVHYACGNTVICDSLAIARELCYERGVRVKAVTLDGTVIHKNGMITGGPSMQDAGRRWDEAEMAGLQRERERCMEELKQLHQSKIELGDEEERAAAIARLQRELQAAQEEQAAGARRTRDLDAEQAHVRTQVDATRARLDDAQRETAALRERIGALERTIDAADAAVFGAFCERVGVANVREYEQQQLQLTEALGHATMQHQRQLVRLAHQRTFTEQQVQSTRDRLALLDATLAKEARRQPQLRDEAARSEEEASALRAQADAAAAELRELREAAARAAEALSERRRTLFNTRRELDAHRKEVATRNDEIESLDAERTSIYRRCRLEGIELPLVAGSLQQVSLDEEPMSAEPDAEEAERDTAFAVRDYGIQLDFALLSDAERADRSSARARELQEQVDAARDEMHRLAPNATSVQQLGALEAELRACEREMDACREHVRDARDEFQLLKKQRTDRFLRAYEHIAARIDSVYKELTRSKAAPMGGVAYLSLEDTDEPYNTGVRYHAMPPMKRFRDMDQLSGGEKTVAALALLFAIHSYQPAPFFVLDEVDAALDAHNVARISNYIREHASERFQFIVISLKAALYERSQALVGVYRNQDVDSSASLTLDLERYA